MRFHCSRRCGIAQREDDCAARASPRRRRARRPARGATRRALVRGAAAHVGQHEQALVALVVLAAPPERVEAVGRREPLEREVREPLEVDAPRGLGVEAVERGVLAEALGRGREGEVGVRSAGRRERHGHPARRQLADQRREDRRREVGDRFVLAQRGEELEGVDRRPVVALARGFGRAHQHAHPFGELCRRAGDAQHHAPAGELQALDPARALAEGHLSDRLLGRVGARRWAASAIARRRGSASAIQSPTRSNTARGAPARSRSTCWGGAVGAVSAASSQSSTWRLVRSAWRSIAGRSKIT